MGGYEINGLYYLLEVYLKGYCSAIHEKSRKHECAWLSLSLSSYFSDIVPPDIFNAAGYNPATTDYSLTVETYGPTIIDYGPTNIDYGPTNIEHYAYGIANIKRYGLTLTYYCPAR